MTDEMKNRLSKLGFSELEMEVIDSSWTPPAEKPKPAKSPKSASSREELIEIHNILLEKFGKDKTFSNKDIFPEVGELGYTNRQTPSRLKAMASFSMLEEVGSSSPKKYRVI